MLIRHQLRVTAPEVEGVAPEVRVTAVRDATEYAAVAWEQLSIRLSAEEAQTVFDADDATELSPA